MGEVVALLENLSASLEDHPATGHGREDVQGFIEDEEVRVLPHRDLPFWGRARMRAGLRVKGRKTLSKGKPAWTRALAAAQRARTSPAA